MAQYQSGGVHKLQSFYFCPECGNLYDITNVSPDAVNVSAEKKIYFRCTMCGNSEIVKPRTLIMTKHSPNASVAYYDHTLDPTQLIHVQTLPHTRDYICPNKDCATHKDLSQKDAVMSRFGNSHQMMYVCCICKTSWK